MSDPARVTAVDLMQGKALVHFADGTSVLFQAQFLYDAREQGGNLEIPNTEQGLQDADQPSTLEL